MSTYQFKVLDTDEIVELDLTWDERNERVDCLRRIILDDGREAELVVQATAPSSKRGSAETQWQREFESLAMSVQPYQAAEFNSFAQQRGLKGVRWDRNGICKVQGRQARKRAAKALGMHDNDGGYGDG